MNYKDWLNLFGRSSEDAEVLARLGERGVKKVPIIARDQTMARVELDDVMLQFSSPELFPSRSKVGDGASVLSGLVLPIKATKWGHYKGEMPLKLQPEDSKVGVRERLGPPKESNERFRWDLWNVEGLKVHVTYTKDLSAISNIVMSLPDEV